MEILLNRWRGTGDLFNIGSFRITGTMLYVIYFIIFAYILSESYVVALFTGAMFLAGESVGFGKWVGYLCYPEEKVLEKEYLDKEGYGFPYIHYVANFIAPEKENFSEYCNTAKAFDRLRSPPCDSRRNATFDPCDHGQRSYPDRSQCHGLRGAWHAWRRLRA